MSDKTVTVAEAAGILGVSTVRVYGLIKQGRLRALKEQMRDGRDITVLKREEVLARKGTTPKRDVIPQLIQLQREIDAIARTRAEPERHQYHVDQARGLARFVRNWVEGRR